MQSYKTVILKFDMGIERGNRKMENITTVVPVKNILMYFLIINLFTFFIMWYDKHEAIKNEWRISERTLFLLVLLGGSIGGIAGMYVFRHKTKKWYFKIGFPAILILQIILISYVILNPSNR